MALTFSAIALSSAFPINAAIPYRSVWMNELIVDRPLTKNPLFFPRLGVSAPWTGLTESSMRDLEKNHASKEARRLRRIPSFRGGLAVKLWALRPSEGYAASVERFSHFKHESHSLSYGWSGEVRKELGDAYFRENVGRSRSPG